MLVAHFSDDTTHNRARKYAHHACARARSQRARASSPLARRGATQPRRLSRFPPNLAPAGFFFTGAAAAMSSGEKIGNWLLGKELGSGHFAKVRLAKHVETGAQCAVKIIKKPTGAPARDEMRRFSAAPSF